MKITHKFNNYETVNLTLVNPNYSTNDFKKKERHQLSIPSGIIITNPPYIIMYSNCNPQFTKKK